MNSAKHTAQKHELWSWIRRAAEAWRDDDPAALTDYAKEVYNANKDNLQDAIACFDELTRQGLSINGKPKPAETAPAQVKTFGADRKRRASSLCPLAPLDQGDLLRDS